MRLVENPTAIIYYDGTKEGWFIYTSRTLKGRWHMVVKCFI
jgi:hypothetical protein